MTEKTRWGLTAEQWEVTVAELTTVLERHARTGETVTYGDVVSEIHTATLRPFRGPLPYMLEQIDRTTFSAEGVMLGAIVRHKGGDGMRGERFFRTAEDLGRDVTDRRAMWEAEVARVFEHYGNARRRG